MAPQDVLELITSSLQELYAETMNPADINLSAASRPSPSAALIYCSPIAIHQSFCYTEERCLTKRPQINRKVQQRKNES